MLNTSKVVAFVATSNAAAARQFYEVTLELTVVSEDPFAIAFDANGTMLRIQKVDSLQPAPYTALGWGVVDIRAAVAKLQSRGVVFQVYDGLGQDEQGVWLAPSGASVAWFKDPDGNTLSLTQF